ncbi:unnamed protein product [Schistosoma margrebowiei]|uniref:Uncharacterized protein n=1 Tax=Schistosoma margrebowiei TaxID=48269 RepID=A0AA85AIZ9_9TREM|nr:unnamed protein product [Schistosoma margrebowiei]
MQFISLIGMWILQLIQLTTMKSMENKIPIVILFDGDRGLQYLNSLLKSIFYHQNGRFRCDLKACCLSNFCDPFTYDCQTVMNNVSTTYTTVFHFLITTISLNSQLLNLMNTWKIRNMEYHFYNCSNYLANLQWISSKHLACAKPFLKLMLTEILPININKLMGYSLSSFNRMDYLSFLYLYQYT